MLGKLARHLGTNGSSCAYRDLVGWSQNVFEDVLRNFGAVGIQTQQYDQVIFRRARTHMLSISQRLRPRLRLKRRKRTFFIPGA